MRIRVAQIGARKGYSLVSALARQDKLESLCTDFYYHGVAVRCLAGLCDVVGANRHASSIRSRRCNEVHDHLVRTFPFTGLVNRLRVRWAIGKGVSHSAYSKGGRAFATAVSRLSWRGVDALYGFSSACLEAFRSARAAGVMCILDYETAPAEMEANLVHSAEVLYEEWLPYRPRSLPPGITAYADRQRDEAELADLVICPSSFGMRLVCEQGTAGEKARCIPFAAGDCFVRKRSPREGALRVLFAGNDAIRKGLPVLVEALRLIPPGVVEARGAGDWSLSDYGWDRCRQAMQVLGPVPRTNMPTLYDWADVFVLPTFSDTMGVVLLEAMASGVPVIATENSGGPDLIRDGLDGFVIPVNSARALAEHLLTLSEDREALATMSENAYARSTHFTLERYGDRVVGEIERIAAQPPSDDRQSS